MNILYLTTHLNIGGITSYVFSLAKALKQRGHDVHVASSSGELLPQFKTEGIRHLYIPIRTKCEFSPRLLISLPRLLAYLKENKIDLMHSQGRVTQVLGYLLERLSSRPHISTCHGFFKNRLSRRIFPCWGRKVVAISPEVAGHLVSDFKVAPDKIRVIYNGIDIEKFKVQSEKLKTQLKKDLGLGLGPLVGIVARLSQVKGHAYLIEAMPLVLKIIPDAQLLIVGDGREERNLKELVRRLGLEKNVFFSPSVKDTAQVLSIMDVFVLPSLKEGLGLSLMEAQAAAVAVIGSDVGGLLSLVENGSTGLLIKPADAQGLAKAIVALLGDPDRRQLLGQNARRFIEQNFSLPKMVAQTEEVYRECLNANS